MKRAALSVIVVLLSTAWGSYNSPIGPATVPPSSIRNELVSSPNPINRSGNLVVTGNVAGGKHFRGTIPYQSPTYFTGPLGSSSFDSFLRWSARSEDYGGSYPGIYTPYYSPSRTVTGTRTVEAGVPGTGIGQSSRYTGGTAEAYPLTVQNTIGLQGASGQNLQALRIMGLSSATGQEVSQGTSIYSSYQRSLSPWLTTSRPASFSRGTGDSEAARESQRLSPSREDLAVRPEMQNLRQELETESLRIESPPVWQNVHQIPLEQERQKDLVLRSEQAATERRTELLRAENEGRSKKDTVGLKSVGIETGQDYGMDAQAGQKKETFESYGWGRQGADGTRGVVHSGVTGGTAGENTFGVLSSNMQGGLNSRSSYGRGLQEGSLLRTGTDNGSIPAGKSFYQANCAQDRYESMLRSEQGVEVSNSRLEFFGDIASHSMKRFNENFAAGDKYLREGKYYQAADSYGLAAIYSDDNPLVFAGKSHALFAAGQYISSAFLLSRALMSLEGKQSKTASENSKDGMSLDCSIFRSNFGLVERDTVENRIVDIEKLSRETDAFELQFLLGYVYYQIGRVEKAEDAIRKAYEKSPESNAIKILKGVIERRLSESGSVKKR